MEKKIALNEIKESLLKARAEAGSLAQEVKWVVCYVEDLTPFRVGDKGRVQLQGDKIWTGHQMNARSLARSLDAQVQAKAELKGRYSVCAMPASGWAVKRVCQLNEMLAECERAAKRGA